MWFIYTLYLLIIIIGFIRILSSLFIKSANIYLSDCFLFCKRLILFSFFNGLKGWKASLRFWYFHTVEMSLIRSYWGFLIMWRRIGMHMMWSKGRFHSWVKSIICLFTFFCLISWWSWLMIRINIPLLFKSIFKEFLFHHFLLFFIWILSQRLLFVLLFVVLRLFLLNGWQVCWIHTMSLEYFGYELWNLRMLILMVMIILA